MRVIKYKSPGITDKFYYEISGMLDYTDVKVEDLEIYTSDRYSLRGLDVTAALKIRIVNPDIIEMIGAHDTKLTALESKTEHLFRARYKSDTSFANKVEAIKAELTKHMRGQRPLHIARMFTFLEEHCERVSNKSIRQFRNEVLPYYRTGSFKEGFKEKHLDDPVIAAELTALEAEIDILYAKKKELKNKRRITRNQKMLEMVPNAKQFKQLPKSIQEIIINDYTTNSAFSETTDFRDF